MTTNQQRLVLLLATCWSVAPFAAEPGVEWELRRDRDSIQIYTSAVEGSRYDAVLSRTIVQDVRLSALVALLKDSEACARWADKCAESYVYEVISASELLVYTHNNLPFPIKDRDVLSRVKWLQDPDSLEVVMNSEATADILPRKKGKLRLLEANVSWQFSPLPNGAIEVINQAHINPGSSLPGWITNRLLVDTPYETMKSFVVEVRKTKYQNAEFDFITEPHLVEIRH